jgi:hypothetical protein
MDELFLSTGEGVEIPVEFHGFETSVGRVKVGYST